MSSRRVTAVFGLACFLLGSMPAALAATAWTPLGPPGGRVLALVGDPSAPDTLYAGVYGGGVFKTVNAGASWTVASRVLRGWSVHALAIDREQPRTLYAGTWDKGVWKTTDGGSNWKKVMGEDRQATITSIVIDPKNSRNIYAATDSGPNDGIHRSNDGGATWTRSTMGLPHNFRMYTLAIDPATPTTLYAGGDSTGVAKSTDGGKTWQVIPANIVKERINAIAVDPGSPDTVYAGTGSEGVYRSTDGGASWTSMSAGPMKDQRVRTLLTDPKHPGTIWAGISNNVLRSDDGGRSWRRTTSGFDYMHFSAFVLDPTHADRIFAGTSGDGVLVSSDGGRSWSGPGAGFFAADITAVASDAGEPQTYWVATRANGVWRSSDAGATWGLKSEGLTDRQTRALLYAPSSRTLYAGTGDGLFTSRDGGASWTQSKDARRTEVIALAADPANPRTMYLKARFLAAYKSTDGGTTWQEQKADFTGQNLNGLFGLAVVPGSPESAFVATHTELWQSTSNGSSFERCCTALPYTRIQSVVYDAASGALYVGTEDEGVLKSTDRGVRWSESRMGLGRANVQALLIDPAQSRTLYAATWNRGIYRTDDGGQSWNRIGGDPPHPDAIALALDPANPGYLLVGMGGGSVWRLDTTAADQARPLPDKAAPPLTPATGAPTGKAPTSRTTPRAPAK